MTIDVGYISAAVITLLVTVDPLGLVPIFVGLTRNVPAASRQRAAKVAPLIAGLILIGALFGGHWLLGVLSISLPAFRIAGGLLLFWIAVEMVFGKRMEEQARTAESAVEEQPQDIAAFPLAIPLIAGPGAITAVILLAGRAEMNPLALFISCVAIAVVMLACFASFSAAQRIGALLGVTGTLVACRLLGLLLASLAVQYVVDGLRAAFLA